MSLDTSSILYNKGALLSLIIFIVVGSVFIFVNYNKQKDFVNSYRSQVNIGSKIENVDKDTFAQKIISKGTTDIISTLSTVSKGTVSVCTSADCELFLRLLGPYSYSLDTKSEVETIKSFVLPLFRVTESQFDSYYGKTLDPTNEVFLKSRYFKSEFFKLKIFQDDSSYYLVLVEEYSKKTESTPRKQEMMDSIDDSLKGLGTISSLESKLYLQQFSKYKTKITENYIYTLFWKFPKNIFSDVSQARLFITTWSSLPDDVARAKVGKDASSIWKSTTNIGKLNVELNKLFVISNIKQIFEKYQLFVQDDENSKKGLTKTTTGTGVTTKNNGNIESTGSTGSGVGLQL